MKVAIVGAAPSSRDLAPYADKSWLIWALSPSTRQKVSRVDCWFELHALSDLTGFGEEFAAPYFEWMKALKCPVYMQGTNEHVPNAVEFPKDELVELFGSDFFTSSIAWMLALAIKAGAKEIAIYGVDMMAGSEYDYQRPGCRYFINMARSKGITVTIPPQSDLDRPVPLYGYGDSAEAAIKLKAHAKEMRVRIAGIEQKLAINESEKQSLLHERAHLDGAIEENIYVRRTYYAWSGPDN